MKQWQLGRTVLWLLLTAPMPCMGSENSRFIPLRTAVHVHTDISTGDNSIREVAAMAVRDGIDAVIFTDHATTNIELGIPPFRNIWKVWWSRNSILRYGPAEYLDQIRQAQVEFPGLILVPGAEVTPYYYWSIDLSARHFQLNRTRQHMLIVGMEDPENYEQLPIIDNPYLETYNKWYMWVGYIALLCAVYELARRAHWKNWHIATVVFLCGCLGANFLKSHRFNFNQYEGDKGISPYEQLVEYGRRHMAPVFWAHPVRPGKVNIPDSAQSWVKHKPRNDSRKSSYELIFRDLSLAKIDVDRTPYTEGLSMRSAYTGFALEYQETEFNSDKTSAAERGRLIKPDSEWDTALRDYCNGTRDSPSWVFGEIDHHKTKSLDEYVTVLWTREPTVSGVLEALQEGKSYVQKGPMQLDFFEIQSAEDGATFTTGDSAPANFPYKVRMGVSYTGGPADARDLRIGLIRSGELIEYFSGPYPLRVDYIDADVPDTPCFYYRLLAVDGQFLIVSNPIFVKALK